LSVPKLVMNLFLTYPTFNIGQSFAKTGREGGLSVKAGRVMEIQKDIQMDG